MLARNLVLLALGDLVRNARDSYEFPGVAANGKRPVADPFHLSIRSMNPVLGIDAFTLHLAHENFMRPLTVVRMDCIQPVHRIRIQARAAAIPDLFVGSGNVECLGAHGVRHPEYFLDMFRDLAKLLLAVVQGLIDPLPLCDVANDAYRMPFSAYGKR